MIATSYLDMQGYDHDDERLAMLNATHRTWVELGTPGVGRRMHEIDGEGTGGPRLYATYILNNAKVREVIAQRGVACAVPVRGDVRSSCAMPAGVGPGTTRLSWLDLASEKLQASPRSSLEAICHWLGIAVDDEWLQAAGKLVTSSLHPTRNYFRWPLREVQTLDSTLRAAIQASPGLEPLFSTYLTPESQPTYVKAKRWALGLKSPEVALAGARAESRRFKVSWRQAPGRSSFS